MSSRRFRVHLKPTSWFWRTGNSIQEMRDEFARQNWNEVRAKLDKGTDTLPSLSNDALNGNGEWSVWVWE